jgi:phosphoenolpyruvate synthase/pyruvate phosphate dikinase
LRKGEWNTGGVRTWVAPERAFFYDNPEKFQGWRCPQGIDPANYMVVSMKTHAVELESIISARDMISGKTLRGKIRKRIELGQVKREDRSLTVQLLIRDALTVRNFKSPFALWVLAQIAPGDDGRGKVVVPVIENSKPIHYFNPIPSSHLRYSKDHVEFVIDGKKELKLGIRPEDLLLRQEPRLEYRYRKNGKNVFITVSSRTGAARQDECVDPAKSEPNGPKAVIQLYNSEVESSGLCFGELEIQGARARLRPDGTALAEQEVRIDFLLSTG